jgi:hypothetical protein
VKIVPSFAFERTSIVPPWAAMICLEIKSPSPTLRVDDGVVPAPRSKGSNSR